MNEKVLDVKAALLGAAATRVPFAGEGEKGTGMGIKNEYLFYCTGFQLFTY